MEPVERKKKSKLQMNYIPKSVTEVYTRWKNLHFSPGIGGVSEAEEDRLSTCLFRMEKNTSMIDRHEKSVEESCSN